MAKKASKILVGENVETLAWSINHLIDAFEKGYDAQFNASDARPICKQHGVLLAKYVGEMIEHLRAGGDVPKCWR